GEGDGGVGSHVRGRSRRLSGETGQPADGQRQCRRRTRDGQGGPARPGGPVRGGCSRAPRLVHGLCLSSVGGSALSFPLSTRILSPSCGRAVARLRFVTAIAVDTG